jgi:hypothetical protein
MRMHYQNATGSKITARAGAEFNPNRWRWPSGITIQLPFRPRLAD